MFKRMLKMIKATLAFLNISAALCYFQLCQHKFKSRSVQSYDRDTLIPHQLIHSHFEFNTNVIVFINVPPHRQTPAHAAIKLSSLLTFSRVSPGC